MKPINGKITLTAKCGHEVEVEFGCVYADGIAEIARDVMRRNCEDCKIEARWYRLAKVAIDGIPLDAYIIANESWNGWAMPYFTREQLEAYISWQNATNCANFDEAEDVVKVILDPDDSEWTYKYGGEDIVVDGKTLHVYGVGAGDWAWSEVEETR
jgi:hypothetical protein